MPLRFVDGFDHYGGDRAKLLDGVYLALSVFDSGDFSGTPRPAPRSGSHCLRIGAGNGNVDGYTGMRRAIGVTTYVCGVGAGYYFDALPANNKSLTIMEWRAENNETHYSLVVTSTGCLAVRPYSDATDDYVTPSPVVVASAWQHIEARLDCDAVNGAIEVRVNGVTVLNLTGINTNTRARPGRVPDSGVAQVVMTYQEGTARFFIDDFFCWTDDGISGDLVNDFIGDRSVATLFANADTSIADMSVVGAAAGRDAIDDSGGSPSTTVDDDTSYLTITGVGKSEFALSDLPANAGAVTGLQIYTRAKKTDAGTCSIKNSLIASGVEAAGADTPITTAYTYYSDIFPINPNTGAPWTPSEVNAALLRLTRTA